MSEVTKPLQTLRRIPTTLSVPPEFRIDVPNVQPIVEPPAQTKTVLRLGELI